MIMPREKRVIQKEDIMPLEVYTQQRKELRKKIVIIRKGLKNFTLRFKHIFLR